MLGALRRRRSARVHHRILIFLEGLAALFDDAGDAGAVLAARLLVEQLEDALERVTWFWVSSRCDSNASRSSSLFAPLPSSAAPSHLLLGVVDIFDFVHERIAEIVSGHVVSPSVLRRQPRDVSVSADVRCRNPADACWSVNAALYASLERTIFELALQREQALARQLRRILSGEPREPAGGLTAGRGSTAGARAPRCRRRRAPA